MHLDPIIITPYPFTLSNKYLIIDGHHRARAAGVLPDKSVLARIISNQDAYDTYGIDINTAIEDVDNAQGAFANKMTKRMIDPLPNY